MAKFRSFVILSINVVTTLLSVSGTENTFKNVCQGDSVQVFQNIEFDRCNATVTLNVNENRYTQIAHWSIQNCNRNITVTKSYEDRVFLHENGSITIHNFHHFDQGKYIVMSKTDLLLSIQEVLINVIVPPSKNCKPTIKRLGNKLLASLPSQDCGRPIATPYWKRDDGVSDTHELMLTIDPGKTRTYTACIEGPALRCAEILTQREFCSTYQIEGNNLETESTVSCSTDAFIAVVTVLGIFCALQIFVIVILVVKLRSYRSKLKYSNKLLHDDQQQDSQRLCGNSRSPTIDQHPGLKERLASDHNMSELVHENPYSIDPDKLRELEELCDADLCKICFTNKTSIFFMPCNHVATCENCSVSLEKCPVCRTTISEKKTICY